jgi:hypothetical protein
MHHARNEQEAATCSPNVQCLQYSRQYSWPSPCPMATVGNSLLRREVALHLSQTPDIACEV